MRTDDNNLRMRLKEALDNLWSRVRSLFDGLDDRVAALERRVSALDGQSSRGTTNEDAER